MVAVHFFLFSEMFYIYLPSEMWFLGLTKYRIDRTDRVDL